MRRALWLMLLVAVVWLAPGLSAVGAEEPSQPVPLEVTLARRPPAAHPPPDPEVVKKDAERAVTEMEARRRDEEALRRARPVPPRRPDLNYDVVSGIQSRSLTDALRRR